MIKAGDIVEITKVDRADVSKGLKVGDMSIVLTAFGDGDVRTRRGLLFKDQVKKVKQENNMNREELQARIKELQEQLDNLPKWPIEGKVIHYSYSTITGGVETYGCRMGSSRDVIKESDAKKLYMKQLLLRDMMNYVAVMHPDWEPDWDRLSINKWGICCKFNIVEVTKLCNGNAFVFGISVSTKEAAKEAAEEMLKVFKDRIEEWY